MSQLKEYDEQFDSPQCFFTHSEHIMRPFSSYCLQNKTLLKAIAVPLR